MKINHGLMDHHGHPVQVSDAQDANGRYKGPAGWPYGVVKKYEKAVWHLGPKRWRRNEHLKDMGKMVDSW